MTTYYFTPADDELAAHLRGRRIVRAEFTDDRPPEKDDRGAWIDGGTDPGPFGLLVLDNGTELLMWGNDGGCVCGAGCYPLQDVAAVDNIITAVEVEERPAHDRDLVCVHGNEGSDCPQSDGACVDGWYRIFVLAEDKRIRVASFEGGDGSGYYGTGFHVVVRDAGARR